MRESPSKLVSDPEHACDVNILESRNVIVKSKLSNLDLNNSSELEYWTNNIVIDKN